MLHDTMRGALKPTIMEPEIIRDDLGVTQAVGVEEKVVSEPAAGIPEGNQLTF